MSKKIISIIIPVYNVERYLDRFLRSLNNQTINNFVAIFIDDKSTDHSLEKLEAFKEMSQFEMVILKNQKNCGQSFARNLGIEYTNDNPTKYVTFLDPDDWMDSDYLEDLFFSAEKNELDICISGIERFDDDDEKVICKEMITMPNQIFTKPLYCDVLAYINPCLYSKLFRFDKVKHIRFIDMKRSEDTCYFFEAICFCNNIMFTNNAKYHYCVRKNSLTGQISDDTYKSMHKGFVEALKFFNNKDTMKYKDFFITQIFIRSSIGGVLRISDRNIFDIRKMEKRELLYLNQYVHGWKKCKYLKFPKKNHGGIKGIALVICAYLYKLHLYFFFVIFYNFVSKVMRIEVRM